MEKDSSLEEEKVRLLSLSVVPIGAPTPENDHMTTQIGHLFRGGESGETLSFPLCSGIQSASPHPLLLSALFDR